MMENFEYLISLVTGLAGYFFGARKNRKESDSISIQNVAASLDVYQQIIDDLEKRLDGMQKKMSEMENTIHNLQNENKQLRQLIELQTK
jgi:cell shape-determining protein MreC